MLLRLRRIAPAIRWAHPRGLLEWLSQELGIARLFWPMDYAGRRLIRGLNPLELVKMQPLMDPGIVSASDADYVKDNDVVLGLVVNGVARAYPWRIMETPHLANDTVAGQPVLVVLCNICSTGVAFDPVADNRRLTFEISHRYNGSVAPRDHQTGSVWAPYLGMAIRGKMKGRRLRMLPLSQMEWGLWRTLHRDTTVLARDPRNRTGQRSRHTIGSPEYPEWMRQTLARWDTRLPHNTLVLGVVTPKGQRVYPLTALRARNGVVNDELGGILIVSLLHMAEGSYAALAFSRILEGRELTFAAGPQGPVDRETGSLWTPDGDAVAGPLSGARLSFVESHVSKWLAWAANFPGIEIYQ